MGLHDRLKYFITKRLPLSLKFWQVYQTGGFGGTEETVSGIGSTLEATQKLREELSALLKRLDVHRFLDAPCGDFHWMQHVDLGSVAYFGVDIVPEIIRENQHHFEGRNRTFILGDLRKVNLPAVDLILCRDCLVHLSDWDVRLVLWNFLRTGAPWLLLTTFPSLETNRDRPSGMGWRPLNLQRPPFNLMEPCALLAEAEEDSEAGEKALGLWSRDQVSRALQREGMGDGES